MVVVVGAVELEAARFTRKWPAGMCTAAAVFAVVVVVGGFQLGVSPAESMGGGFVGLSSWVPKIEKSIFCIAGSWTKRIEPKPP